MLLRPRPRAKASPAPPPRTQSPCPAPPPSAAPCRGPAWREARGCRRARPADRRRAPTTRLRGIACTERVALSPAQQAPMRERPGGEAQAAASEASRRQGRMLTPVGDDPSPSSPPKQTLSNRRQGALTAVGDDQLNGVADEDGVVDQEALQRGNQAREWQRNHTRQERHHSGAERLAPAAPRQGWRSPAARRRSFPGGKGGLVTRWLHHEAAQQRATRRCVRPKAGRRPRTRVRKHPCQVMAAPWRASPEPCAHHTPPFSLRLKKESSPPHAHLGRVLQHGCAGHRTPTTPPSPPPPRNEDVCPRAPWRGPPARCA